MSPAFEFNAGAIVGAQHPLSRYLALRVALSERARAELARAVCLALRGTSAPHRALLRQCLADMGVNEDRRRPAARS